MDQSPNSGRAMRPVLVINAGSSSIKAAVFGADLKPLVSAIVGRIGPDAFLSGDGQTAPVSASTHADALAVLLAFLQAAGFSPDGLAAAGHRVVHGGAALTAPCDLTPATIGAIEACTPLAPLHNPHNLAAIQALASLAPGLRQTASFDTAFHATNPPEALRFALPDEPATQGLRRYGFHGLSYASLCEALPGQTGKPLPRRLLAYHLGNGASACAILDGRSVATTMGYSPLDGLTMGTRSGSLDPQAVLTLIERIGLEQTRILLNYRSGLAGLSGGTSDMQALLARTDDAARFAVAHFIHWAVRHGGSMIAAMGGVDAVAFTGGIGEHAAPVRDGIMAGLAFTGAPGHVVPAAEERQIARDAYLLLAS